MDKSHVGLLVLAAMILSGISACGERSGANVGAAQTGFPGQVTAGGGTSGEVMARTAQAKDGTKDGSYAGGTPGIAGGSGGNTGGAATGGSVQESGRGPSHGVNAPQGSQASSSSTSATSATSASATSSTTRR